MTLTLNLGSGFAAVRTWRLASWVLVARSVAGWRQAEIGRTWCPASRNTPGVRYAGRFRITIGGDSQYLQLDRSDVQMVPRSQARILEAGSVEAGFARPTAHKRSGKSAQDHTVKGTHTGRAQPECTAGVGTDCAFG